MNANNLYVEREYLFWSVSLCQRWRYCSRAKPSVDIPEKIPPPLRE
ncbi:hypothetical protein Gotur_008391 [Gossypium turneri]